mmetsp:Transcript_34267/g.80072  ORF Transcript_34267/g.80072 Transcript_34267/m.80072 type:complete len:371 (-) Transcript_34267:231-1343(-)
MYSPYWSCSFTVAGMNCKTAPGVRRATSSNGTRWLTFNIPPVPAALLNANSTNSTLPCSRVACVGSCFRLLLESFMLPTQAGFAPSAGGAGAPRPGRALAAPSKPGMDSRPPAKGKPTGGGAPGGGGPAGGGGAAPAAWPLDSPRVCRMAFATAGSRSISACLARSAVRNCMAICLLLAVPPPGFEDTGTMLAVALARETGIGNGSWPAEGPGHGAGPGPSPNTPPGPPITGGIGPGPSCCMGGLAKGCGSDPGPGPVAPKRGPPSAGALDIAAFNGMPPPQKSAPLPHMPFIPPGPEASIEPLPKPCPLQPFELCQLKDAPLPGGRLPWAPSDDHAPQPFPSADENRPPGLGGGGGVLLFNLCRFGLDP